MAINFILMTYTQKLGHCHTTDRWELWQNNTSMKKLENGCVILVGEGGVLKGIKKNECWIKQVAAKNPSQINSTLQKEKNKQYWEWF